MVAAAFAEAGLPLFDDLAPQQPTPGRLTRSKKLEDISDACVMEITSDDAPAFYLDGPDQGERAHHAEVRDFQAVLQRREVRKALRDLGIDRPPVTLLLHTPADPSASTKVPLPT
jgi:hypothetical protein